MDDAALAQRFGAIEQQLALISERLGLECRRSRAPRAPRPSATAAGVPAEVVELARRKQTHAISRLRHSRA